MSKYLVILSHACDDNPLRMFDTHDEATAYIRRLDPKIPADLPDLEVMKLRSTDASTPCCLAVVELGEFGRLLAWDVLRDVSDWEPLYDEYYGMREDD
jgi:hypothetical protein